MKCPICATEVANTVTSCPVCGRIMAVEQPTDSTAAIESTTSTSSATTTWAIFILYFNSNLTRF